MHVIHVFFHDRINTPPHDLMTSTHDTTIVCVRIHGIVMTTVSIESVYCVQFCTESPTQFLVS